MQAQRSPAMVAGGGGAATAATPVGMPSQAAVPVRRRCEGTAMGAITLDLRPGLGVGSFTLGEHPRTLSTRRRPGRDRRLLPCFPLGLDKREIKTCSLSHTLAKVLNFDPILTRDLVIGAGMPISDAFAQIEHHPNIYDVVHVKYFDEVCAFWFWYISF